MNTNQLIKGAYLAFEDVTVQFHSFEANPKRCWVVCDGRLSEGKYVSERTEDLSPIPITPEWLERLGFEKVITENSYEYLPFSEVWKKRNIDVSRRQKKQQMYDVDFYDSGCKSQKIIDGIQYVHELQLAVVLFTGKLLEIKQNP